MTFFVKNFKEVCHKRLTLHTYPPHTLSLKKMLKLPQKYATITNTLHRKIRQKRRQKRLLLTYTDVSNND